MTSPYDGKTSDQWLAITEDLVRKHPLSHDVILEVANVAWDGVWSTQIGKGQAQLSLKEVNPPATIVGYFFEKLFANELTKRYPKVWRGEAAGNEKDLHCLTDTKYSTEIKASGQLGLKIYGNRSYGQVVENAALAKKDKSGYYITVNFFGDRLTLIRFGWIDASDWKPQKSPTGQMAGLGDDVYNYKLLPIKGNYTLQTPVRLLPKVGEVTENKLIKLKIYTIQDLLDYQSKLDSSLVKVRNAAIKYKTQFDN